MNTMRTFLKLFADDGYVGMSGPSLLTLFPLHQVPFLWVVPAYLANWALTCKRLMPCSWPMWYISAYWSIQGGKPPTVKQDPNTCSSYYCCPLI